MSDMIEGNSTIEEIQRLRAGLERHTRQLTTLYEVGRTLTGTLDLREIYRVMFHEIAQKLLGAPHLTVALYEPETEMIYCGFAIVDGQEIDPTPLPRIPLDGGPVSDTIRTRQPRIVDLRGLGRQLVARGRAVLVGDERMPQSALYVPMVAGDKVVGVMHIQRYEADAFREADLLLLPILANYAAIALANARLFAEAQRHVAELEHLDRLKDQFIANINHELRTPLTNIELYVTLLEHGRPEKQDGYLRTLHHEMDRLEKLIEDLLEFSQLDLSSGPIQVAPTDLNRLAVALVADRSTLAGDRGLLLDCLPDPDLPPALADPDKIDQAVSNLVANAMNYTPRGGSVTLITAVRRWADSEWVTLSVGDTGPGISAEEMPHLFERFFRGEASLRFNVPGTGLGLAICKELVEWMGGRITVESQPGQGAAFTVWLKPAPRLSST